MVLVDTSVWVDHFRNDNHSLSEILHDDLVLTHPFVIGELACGSFKHRIKTLDSLKELPSAVCATNDEIFQLIETHKLWTFGVGFIDAGLLASSLLTSCHLWTLDRKLRDAANQAKVGLFN